MVYVDFDLSEPDPALFQIPERYEVKVLKSGDKQQPWGR